MRILMIDDEPIALNVLAKGLREEGYAVDTALDAEQGLYKIFLNQYDLLILDIVLGRRDGFSVCEELRAKDFESPILMLTGRDGVGDRVRGLDVGADDYLTKPFEVAELLARIRALLRRSRQKYTQAIDVADLHLDLTARTLTRAGVPIHLTSKEYAILSYLAKRQGELVSREDIGEHAWDESFDPFSNIIEVYMLRLRRKIDAPFEIKVLHTRRREGYILGTRPTFPEMEEPPEVDFPG